MTHKSIIRKCIRKYIKSRNGNFAIITVISMSALLMAIGASVDISRLASMKLKAQNNADNAALSAAIYMNNTAKSQVAIDKRREKAKQIALESLDTFLLSDRHTNVNPIINITSEKVTVNLDVKAKAVFMQMFGRETLDHKVVSVVGLGKTEALLLDIALISDATGSMQTTLNAIQNNMKKFTRDLNKELKTRKIAVGSVRIKFIFYRDLMIDNHKDWSGPKMTLKPGLEGYGPLYSSKFFSIPSEKIIMDKYVDYFVASGGGSLRESGMEAIWYALGEQDWRDPSKTVRSIILWTDAPTRAIGDIEEIGLQPYPGYLLMQRHWTKAIGSFFVPWSKSTREKYMFDTYAKAYTPPSFAALKSRFDSFHADNANGFEDVSTMTINVIGNCLGVSPCGAWPEIAKWDGVEYYYERNVFSASKTYKNIISQVADTVEKQLKAKDIAIES